MLFESRHGNFDSPQRRKEFATVLKNIVDALPYGFEPYCPNEHDDYFWTIDSGNDWKVSFYRENPNRFSVTYRYQRGTPRAEESLGEWLKYRLNVRPIE